jgi:Arc/MetJ-type ribon-helix-helix transcriptional regulator
MEDHVMGSESGEKGSEKGIWSLVEEKLRSFGVDLEELCGAAEAEDGAKVKVVCVAPDLGASVRDLGRSPRENVVMVRVDQDTLQKLDAWVETGAVKSRSEAAALFIREGLQVRGDELDELADALQSVEQAKERLREKAKTVFGQADAPPTDPPPGEPA